MVRKMTRMSAKGDELVKEWDSETVEQNPDLLEELAAEFDRRMKEGYFAADITDGKNELIRKFDPNADILLMPRMMGGA